MIVVIFELEPHADRVTDYFALATRLKDEVEKIDGFISIDRFESVNQPGKFVSLSFWRDEKAIEDWRNIEAHRYAQREGRNGIFSQYRLRIAEVKRDYGLSDREQAPADSQSALP